jgi:hypothetical protein
LYDRIVGDFGPLNSSPRMLSKEKRDETPEILLKLLNIPSTVALEGIRSES